MGDHKRKGFMSHDVKEPNRKTGNMEIHIEDEKNKQEETGLYGRSEVIKTLNKILVKEVGQFGRYQKWRTLMLAVTLVMLPSCGEVNFTAARIEKRCFIGECEPAIGTEFSPSWLPRAIPPVGQLSHNLDACRRFANATPFGGYEQCSAASFDREHTLPCDKFLYKNRHTVVFAFDLGCSEWWRSLIGMASATGRILTLPLTEYVAWKFGWRHTILLGVLFSGCFGLLRSFAETYNDFVGLQFLEAIFSSGIHFKIIKMASELVGPDYTKILFGCLMVSLTLRQLWLSLLAWLLPDWWVLTCVLYLPQLFSLVYLWTLDESFIWHLHRGRIEHFEALLKKVARTNGTKLSEKSLLSIRAAFIADMKKKYLTETCGQTFVRAMVKDKLVLMRCLVMPLIWAVSNMIDFGLTINSVYLSGNMSFQYAAVTVASMLGMWIGCKKAISRQSKLKSYWICGICQLLYYFGATDMYWTGLALYLVSKCCISVMFPALATNSNTLNLFYLLFGQLGAVVATLTPAMGYELEHIQFLLFGVLALGCTSVLHLMPARSWVVEPAFKRDDPPLTKEDPVSSLKYAALANDYQASMWNYPALTLKDPAFAPPPVIKPMLTPFTPVPSAPERAPRQD